MSNNSTEAPESPNPETSRTTSAGAVIRFVLGAVLGAAATCFIQPIMFLMVNPIDGEKSLLRGLAPLALDGALLVLMVLLLIVVIRRRKPHFFSGVVVGASLALLLSAACWGLNFLPPGAATR